MGATESKREPKGPGTSRVPEMFTDDIEVLDVKSKLGIVRVYWVRKELKETVSKRPWSTPQFHTDPLSSTHQFHTRTTPFSTQNVALLF